jgi:hypothetical protein
MGKIIEIKPEDVVPTQDFLIEENLTDFVASYVKQKKDAIILAKQDNFGNIIGLDGHHRGTGISLLQKLGQKYKLFAWVANNDEDYIESLPNNFYQEGDTIHKMNDNLGRLFHKTKPIYGKTLEDIANNHYFSKNPMKLLKNSINKK